MADIDSNLPIFSRGTSAPVVISKDTSANATSNPVYVQLSDGTSAVGITSGALDVNIASGSVTVTATNLDIRDLASTQDEVAIGDGTNQLDLVVINSAFGATPTAMPMAGKYEATPTTYGDGDAVPLLLDENGRLQVDISSISGVPGKADDAAFTIATDLVSPMGGLFDDTATDSVDEGDVGLVRMSGDRRLYVQPLDASGNAMPMMDAVGRAGYQFITDGTNTMPTMDVNTRAGYVQITDGTDDWSIDGSGFGQVDLAAQSLTAVKVSATAAANTETNPIFVQVVSGALSGIEILDYDTVAAVAVDAASNHDYTVTAASTLKVQCCFGSSSAAQKIEIQAGPVASLATKAVQFTSMANPNWLVDFKGLLEVPDTSTGTLRIIRTNRDEGAADVYSSILATEI